MLTDYQRDNYNELLDQIIMLNPWMRSMVLVVKGMIVRQGYGVTGQHVLAENSPDKESSGSSPDISIVVAEQVDAEKDSLSARLDV